MPPRRRGNRTQAPTSRGYARLEGKLALLGWLHRLLGYDSTRDLLGDIKPINEGFHEDGRSQISVHLEARSDRMQGLTVPDLQRYDENIREHLAAMNHGRSEPITLRYFQYLAALYTEIYLDWYFNRSGGLLPSLNDLVSQHNANCAPARDGTSSRPATCPSWPSGWPPAAARPYCCTCTTGNSSITTGAAGQHPADYSQRRADPAAPGRTPGVQHPRRAFRPQ